MKSVPLTIGCQESSAPGRTKISCGSWCLGSLLGVTRQHLGAMRRRYQNRVEKPSVDRAFRQVHIGPVGVRRKEVPQLGFLLRRSGKGMLLTNLVVVLGLYRLGGPAVAVYGSIHGTTADHFPGLCVTS